ncbi:cytochrome b/b6 domain-containing protein [Novosphingobium sp.]|uniref:cytochrome b/b6 domain-containing protein n=1 Tax=Novosphingobium sp. TaxID=1874826 RepID=UPI00263788F3|nr:cytochrome b/b6 domain-containing protein [Novosphingobium sp.]
MAAVQEASDMVPTRRHQPWVRLTHWLIALAVLVLIYSGIAILMVHPRFYWGTVGNDLMKPIFEVPVGPNFHAMQWSPTTAFFGNPDGPVTADRLAEPWNGNGWARSMHFLAAWAFLLGLAVYLGLGALTGHARRALLPGADELTAGNIGQDIKAHLRLPMPTVRPGPPYGVLQKLTYAMVAFVALPLMFLTGITMSPAITASYPVLLDVFGGGQSARTIHFFTFSFLALFLLVHLVMIVLTGPLRQLRAMTLGK